MRFGLISLGGTSSQWTLQKASELFDVAEDIDIRKIYVQMSSNKQEIFYKGKPLSDFDCVYVKGSFRYQLLQTAISKVLMGESYLPLKPEAFQYCHNKFSTMLALHKKDIPIPTTHYAPNVDVAKKILEEVSYPIIIKIPEGTQGKGVMFADSLASAKSVLDTMSIFKQPYLIQEYIETGATDVRAIVVGNRVVAAMRRKAAGEELRANIHMGGVGENYELDYDTEQLAIKTARAVGADVCGVDILEGSRTVIIEVNTSPGLKGITEATKKDISGMIAKFLFEKAREFSEQKKKSDYNDIMGSLTQGVNQPKEILANLDIRAGMIKLKPIFTKIAGFRNEQEVAIKVQKGKIEIQEYKLKGGNNKNA